MKRIKSSVAFALFIVLAGVVGWFGTKQYRCKRRNAEFSRRIEIVEKDAREQLKVGTRKDAVARFYKEHESLLRSSGSMTRGFKLLELSSQLGMRTLGLRNRRCINRSARKGGRGRDCNGRTESS